MVDEGHIDWEERELREIFRSILMTTCDIGAITKPWDVSRKVSPTGFYEYTIETVNNANSTYCLIRYYNRRYSKIPKQVSY